MAKAAETEILKYYNLLYLLCIIVIVIVSLIILVARL
jgi:hypothetical protein